MEEVLKIIIGMFILILGFPIGKFLAKITSEELREGQKWFRILIMISIIGSIVSLIIRNDIALFTFLFIIIVTSRSLNPIKKK